MVGAPLVVVVGAGPGGRGVPDVDQSEGGGVLHDMDVDSACHGSGERGGQGWVVAGGIGHGEDFGVGGVDHFDQDLGGRAGRDAGGTCSQRSWCPARPNIWRLSILIRLTWPSTAPELQGRARPVMTASRSRSMPAASLGRPGRSSCWTAASQSGRRSPWRSVSMTAKARTCRVGALISGQWVRTVLSSSCSASGRVSGRRRIQPVTVRGEGGRATTGRGEVR